MPCTHFLVPSNDAKRVVIAVLALLAATSAATVVPGSFIDVTVIAAPMMREHQTFVLTPELVKTQLDTALSAHGLRIAGDGPRQRLTVALLSYDSGHYVGLAKTARIEIAYRLQPDADAVETQWQDSCEATAKFDLQSTAKRNADAVRSCLTMLGERLAERLAQ